MCVLAAGFIASTAFSSDDAPWWLKAAGIPDDVLESIGELINKTLANQSHTADTLVVKEDCWYACGERSGACPDFCGALIEVVSYSGARRELSTSPCPSAAGNESACCRDGTGDNAPCPPSIEPSLAFHTCVAVSPEIVAIRGLPAAAMSSFEGISPCF